MNVAFPMQIKALKPSAASTNSELKLNTVGVTADM